MIEVRGTTFTTTDMRRSATSAGAAITGERAGGSPIPPAVAPLCAASPRRRANRASQQFVPATIGRFHVRLNNEQNLTILDSFNSTHAIKWQRLVTAASNDHEKFHIFQPWIGVDIYLKSVYGTSGGEGHSRRVVQLP